MGMNVPGGGTQEGIKEPMVIGNLASGEEVYVVPDSHFFTHPETHPTIKAVLARLSSSSLSLDSKGIARPEVVIEGKKEITICVPVTEGDKFVYAKRAPRSWHTRFVVDREPAETNTMSLVLRKDESLGKFRLYTAFWGPQAPREPADLSLLPDSPEYKEASEFWLANALILPKDEAGMRKLGIDPTKIKDSLAPGQK